MSYAAEVLTDNPLFYLRLGDGSGAANAVDASGNGRHGIFQPTADSGAGAPTTGAAGALGLSGDTSTAVHFPGNNAAKIYIPNTDVPAVTQFTAECWVNPDAATGDHAIFHRCYFPSSFSSDYWSWYLFRVGLKIYAAVFTTTTANVVLISSGNLVEDQYTHVVFTYDGTMLRLYFNGVLDSTLAHTGTLWPGTQWYPTIGASWSLSGTQDFLGSVDEAAFYDHVLSAGRIADHYAAAIEPPVLAVPLYLGNTQVDKLYLGNNEVDGLMLGNTEIY